MIERGSFSLLLTLLASGSAFAHPMGNFSVNRWTQLSVRAGGVDVTHVVDFAEIPSQKELSNAGFSAAPAGEARERFRDALAARLAPGLELDTGGKRASLRIVRSSLDIAPGVADLPTLRLTIELSADVAAGGESVVTFADRNDEGRAGWKEVIAVARRGASIIAANVPDADRSRRLTDYPTDPAVPPSEVTSAMLRVRFGPEGTR